MYTIKETNRKNFLEAYDQDNNVVGGALLSPFIPSDIYERPRLSIYIDIMVKDIANKDVIKDELFEELMIRSRAIKSENKDIDVKVYHCCFSDNQENIDYYSSKEGFIHDDGMYIIKKDISEESFQIVDINGIDFVELALIDEEEIAQLVEKQNQVFNSGYSVEDLKELKLECDCVSIAAKYKDEIVGNIIIVVKSEEGNNPYGWIDDLFVTKEWRKKGIAKNLLYRAFEILKTKNVKESKLEVWSENEKALALYYEVGYQFYEESESAIGMFL